MTRSLTVRDLGQVQSAADRLVNAEPEVKESALEELSQTILGLFDEAYDSTATNKLLSRELSLPIQNFGAVWFVRCLSKSSSALKFGDTERLTADLCDRVFQNNVYRRINLGRRSQTFEKLRALEGHLYSVLSEVDALVSVPPNLGQLNSFQQKLLGVLNNRGNQPYSCPPPACVAPTSSTNQ